MSNYAPTRPSRSTRRSRSRWPRRLAVTALVLVLLLIAADRIGVVVAQKAAARTLQTSQSLPREPSVTIDGFPFLTQLAARDLGRVTVHAGDVPVGDSNRRVTISRMTVVLHDLSASRDLTTFTARRGEAAATISYPELSRVVGIDLRYGGDGRVTATKSVTVLGQQFTASVSASVRVVDGALSFANTAVSSAAGSVPPVVEAALSQEFGSALSLAGLPFGLQVRSLDATPEGIAVSLTARDLVYRR